MTPISYSEPIVRAAPRSPARLSAMSCLQIAPAVLLLVLFFALPLLRSIWDSFNGTSFSFQRYHDIFTDEIYYVVFNRTLRTAVICTVASVALGFPLAYFMSTLNRRAATFVGVFVLVPLFTAIIIRTYAWMTILSRGGVLNKALLAVGLIDSPIRILGTSTAVYLVMIHVLIPIAVLVMYSSMARIDRTLLTAAQVLGATPVQAFLRVLVPLYVPGIISASMLVFILTMGAYVVPPLVGAPSDAMITQLIVSKITSLFDLKTGYALSASLLGVTLLVLAVSNIVVPVEQVWSLQTSQKTRNWRGRLVWQRLAVPTRRVQSMLEAFIDFSIGRPAWLVPTLLKAYVALLLFFIVAPLTVVYALSFSSSPFLVFPPPGFSLQWYERFFTSPEWRAALIMSLKVAVVVASLATAICSAAAFGLVRGQFQAKRLLFVFIVSPLLIPGIVVALSIYVSISDLGLIGTYAGLVIGHLVGAVPAGVVIVLAAVRGLDRNLEHAAASLGASPFRTLRTIVLPLLAPALGSAWVMSFLHSFDELLVTLFVLGRQSQTVPVKMWGDIQIQIDPVISAASCTIMTVVALIIIVSQYRALALQKPKAPIVL
ncbi:hypothetical protein BST63_02805 [Bradyrhizobium canariense]|uniref:ABC transmembrane type-1 domain-containing protein n=1 Tax=Bradyrhizobium canariense TaxID=255045 RepID=A0ABX3XBW1_9BRAD|nr:ABC transporter permease subunit [Bradyrhizobium canariense]OSJ19439.1 hypothetical protein BSR47_02910 [Bradyrhizobium canariense]OSJ34901.1 hypothetical protein BST63_02805 [Bradyrhizobium canariense]